MRRLGHISMWSGRCRSLWRLQKLLFTRSSSVTPPKWCSRCAMVNPSLREYRIWTGGQFDRLDLQTLSGDETTILVSAALSGPLDPDAARRLWKLTHGNVLYMRNIVEQEVGDGRLVRQHGYWRWIGEPIVPPILVELIESRFVPGGGFESMGEWREGDNFEAGFSAASEAVAWVLKLLLLAARRQR